MSEAGEAFDRASEAEDTARRRQEMSDSENVGKTARGTTASGLAFFGSTLLIHWVIVGRLTVWLIAHMIFVAMCVAGLVAALLGAWDEGADQGRRLGADPSG